MNSPKLLPVRVGGVPEHFNLPWHFAREQRWFQHSGIDLKWRDYPEGTGAMAAHLLGGELDAAVLLSEGAIAAIARGVPIRIVGWAVASPLIWGIHTGQAGLANLDAVKQPVFAISRYGSGSHLMAHVLADQQSWPKPQFEVVDNLDGAVQALADGRAQLFLWERFTTQPVVDRGDLRRIGEIPTPWPAFCLSVSEKMLAEHEAAIRELWSVACDGFAAMDELEHLAQRIAETYRLAPGEVKKWLSLTRWGDGSAIDEAAVQAIIDRLAELELLENPVSPGDCLVAAR